MTNPTQRSICIKCLRSEKVCLCHHVQPFETQSHFVILMHSKELRHRSSTGSGRLAHLCLKNSSLFTGVTFENMQTLKALLDSKDCYPCVLYPGPDSHTLTAPKEAQYFKQQLGSKKPLVFVLDASWSLAKKILKLNPFLQKLPSLSFETTRRSNYIFKRQPHEICLSTMEAIDEILGQFGNLGIEEKRVAQDKQNLMLVFNQMVTFQNSFSPSRNEKPSV